MFDKPVLGWEGAVVWLQLPWSWGCTEAVPWEAQRCPGRGCFSSEGSTRSKRCGAAERLVTLPGKPNTSCCFKKRDDDKFSV